jgi:hypothetical protein
MSTKNKWRTTIYTGKREANITTNFVWNVELRNMMTSPFCALGWSYWGTTHIATIKDNNVFFDY